MQVDETKLRTLSNLAQEMRETDYEIQELETKLKSAKQKYEQYSAVEIPQFMADLGIREFKLSDGTKFAVLPVLALSVPKGTIDTVEEWLADHDHSGLVKVTVSLPRDQVPKLEVITSFLNKNNIQYDIKKTIHPQTLNAWGREMENEGMVIPEDIFNVYRSNKTVMK